jgi:hypothetical protein
MRYDIPEEWKRRDFHRSFFLFHLLWEWRKRLVSTAEMEIELIHLYGYESSASPEFRKDFEEIVSLGIVDGRVENWPFYEFVKEKLEKAERLIETFRRIYKGKDLPPRAMEYLPSQGLE